MFNMNVNGENIVTCTSLNLDAEVKVTLEMPQLTNKKNGHALSKFWLSPHQLLKELGRDRTV